MVWSRSARVGMSKVLNDFRPDVVHFHNIYHQLSPSILSPVVDHGAAAVMTLHDYKLVCPTYRLLAGGEICEACVDGRFSNAVRKRCNGGSLAASALSAFESALHRKLGVYGDVDLFLCPSQFLLDKMAEARVYPEKLRLNPNFVKIADLAPATEPGNGVVFAGRLSPEKGVDTLIEAVAILGVRLELAGDGPERERLEDLATRLGADVVFHGHLRSRDVQDLLRRSCVSVLPARWYENQPLAVLESFAVGVPVVASELGGAPELVNSGEDGFLVPHDDANSLADALADILASPSVAFEMGKAGRRKVEGRFSPQAHMQRLTALYGEALET